MPTQAAPKIKLVPRLTSHATVRVEGYVYLVDFGPGGAKPRYHAVLKSGSCTCDLSTECPAVEAVREYRKAGGEQAPEPPLEYCAVAPDKCPICGARTYETGLVHPQKGVEWVCNANYWHYRQQMLKLVLRAHPPSPWRFPPVAIRAGVQLNAWEGTQPGDQILSLGVLEAEIRAVAYG